MPRRKSTCRNLFFSRGRGKEDAASTNGNVARRSCLPRPDFRLRQGKGRRGISRISAASRDYLPQNVARLPHRRFICRDLFSACGIAFADAASSFPLPQGKKGRGNFFGSAATQESKAASQIHLPQLPSTSRQSSLEGSVPWADAAREENRSPFLRELAANGLPAWARPGVCRKGERAAATIPAVAASAPDLPQGGELSTGSESPAASASKVAAPLRRTRRGDSRRRGPILPPAPPR